MNLDPKARAIVGVIFAAAGLFLGAVRAQDGNDDARLLKDAQQAFRPLPKNAATPEFPITPERVELGRKLFFDPRISADGTVSCSRCHLPALYGRDGLPKAKGVFDRLNDRRAPTVFNAALQFKEHWRGDRENVEDQATKAPTGAQSFGNSDNDGAVTRLKAIPGYAEPFQKAFPGEPNPVTIENWGKAIGAFERTLLTPGRFDEYLAGNIEALAEPERQGLHTFMAAGCGGCHDGVLLGGEMFQKFGVFEDYWKQTGTADIDKGRFDVTHNPADMYVFKVPQLRNVAVVGPYFHDGSIRELSDAVRIMAQVQLGKKLSPNDVASIVTFLDSLTGKPPQSFLETPVLPPGSFATTPASAVRSAK